MTSASPDGSEAPVTTFALGMVSLVAHLPGIAERLLVDTAKSVTAGQKVLTTVADALEDGLLDEVRGVLRTVEPTSELVYQVAQQLERTLPLIDSTLNTVVPLAEDALSGINRAVAVVDQLPSAVEELKEVRQAAEKLVGLASLALEPLDLIPGAGLVRRQIGKVGAAATRPLARPIPSEADTPEA